MRSSVRRSFATGLGSFGIGLAAFLVSPFALAQPPAGECPQPRFTGKAPAEYLALKDPLPSDAQNLKAGEKLFLGKSDGARCAMCHGKKGDGKGPMAEQFVPRPRNFACAETVNGIPDGQLFWIIRFGSPGTSMPAHDELDDTQIWQLVAHLRRLAR